MSDIVIKVENLSKQYRIGSREAGYKTFCETLVDSAKAPFLRLSGAMSKALRAWSKNIDSPPPAPGSKLSSPDDTIWALKNVSFEVKRGEVVGIIGRNGAGKSTLLKILSKIIEPTEGRVELRGRIGSLLEVGTGFHPELTGHENVYLYGAILGMDRWEVTRKFDEIVAFAELEKFIDTPVKKYSSGMYMRLAFAVAAHLEPEILLVDEVLAVGDAAFQKKCLGKMDEVADEGRTVLFVSHNMASIAALCSRGLLLSNGQLNMDSDSSSTIGAYLDGILSPSETSETFSSSHIRALGVHMRDLDNNASDKFKMGEGFKVIVDVIPNRTYHNVNLHLILRDRIGTKISTVCTPETPGGPFDIIGSTRLTATIVQNPLMPGDYSWFVRLRWQQHRSNLIEVENALSFSIIPRNLPEAPVAYGSIHGVVFLGAQLDQKLIAQ